MKTLLITFRHCDVDVWSVVEQQAAEHEGHREGHAGKPQQMQRLQSCLPGFQVRRKRERDIKNTDVQTEKQTDRQLERN